MLERLYEWTLRLPGWESSFAEPRPHHVSEAFLNLQTNQVTSWTLPSDPSSVQFSSVSRVWLFATPWTAERQAFLSITNSRSILKLMSFELVMPSNHLILSRALLLLFPILASIRVSLQSKRLSRVFSNTTVQKHQFFRAQFSLGSSSHAHTWPRIIVTIKWAKS